MNHQFVAMAKVASCGYVIEEFGRPSRLCGEDRGHLVHSGRCVHCGQALELEKGFDDVEVCRYCRPHFANAPRMRYCRACADGTFHA